MKSILLSCVVILVSLLQANAQGFLSDYAPANWTILKTSNGNPSGVENTGSVNVSDAPASITIIGSDGPTSGATLDVNVNYTIQATTAGKWSFDWSYITNDDSAQFDPFYVIINNTAILLTNDALGDQPQSGTFTSSSNVSIGDIIGFRLSSAENAFGNATVTISNFSAPAAVLPVTFIAFDAKQSGEFISLKWSTASETNNDRFEIERSSDGRNFISLLDTKGAGNSTTIQYYETVDKNPFSGINYYRIKQVDLDGQYTYSTIKVIKWEMNDPIKLFPNPARNNITLRITPQRTENASIQLVSADGQVVKVQNVAAVAGSNLTTDWDLQLLQPGIYFFKANFLNYPLRFVKQ